MLDFTINVGDGDTIFRNFTRGFIKMANQLEPKRFWAIWSIFFILAIGVAGAVIVWAYATVMK